MSTTSNQQQLEHCKVSTIFYHYGATGVISLGLIWKTLVTLVKNRIYII